MKKATFLLLLAILAGVACLQAQTPQIFFEIRNEQVIAGGTKYQFDVYMGADEAGTFHSSGILFIGFNPVAFGSNVVASSKVTFTHLDLLNETLYFSPSTPKYTTNVLADHESDIFKIGWSTNFPSLPPSATFHTSVPDSLAPLYRIVITFQNNLASKDLRFIDTLMLGQQKYLYAAGVQIPYGDGYFPVEWVHFSADPVDDEHVNLFWITAREVNNDYFLIEKKVDDESFKVVGRVAGAGNSSGFSEYEFQDESPMGRTNVYRLRQVDFDGGSSYSSQVEARFENSVYQIMVFPSPAYEVAWLRVSGESEARYYYRLTDMQGKVLIQDEFRGSEQVRLGLDELPQGVYLLRVEGEQGESMVQKLIKLNR